MNRLTVLALLAMAPATASAQQYVTYAAPPTAYAAPAYAVTGPVTTTGTYYAPTTRRQLRQANRYTVMRPVYGNRPGVTFAPYSDRYFPKVAPGAPAYVVSPQPTYYMVRPR